ncbi:MAG: rod shape-determining protein MreC [Chloroflexi bacterium]|nr:MAG: rod shape-determining protein MreC [Chloroflexota bacterium]
MEAILVKRIRSNPITFFFASVILTLLLLVGSITGVLTPVEHIIAFPLNFVSGIFNGVTLDGTQTLTDLSEIQSLRQRNADLEEALALFQAELVELREIASDYNRLADLLEYTRIASNQEFLAADVIGRDQSGFLRTIIINKGARDSLQVGMPVVTRQGLVGRIMDVSANASRVLLITDQSSAISARLQTSRAEGTVVGQLSGNLRMTFIPLSETIQEGDLVITSGLGGNFPPDIVIGQVTSRRQLEFELFQEAEVRSLNNFNTLEIVLVITNFEPVDISAFDADAENADAGN